MTDIQFEIERAAGRIVGNMESHNLSFDDAVRALASYAHISIEHAKPYILDAYDKVYGDDKYDPPLDQITG